MTLAAKRRELARYRLQQADECLDEARYLPAAGKAGRSVVNRAYYATFYAVPGLLAFEDYSSSKRSGVIGYCNRELVRTGRLPKSLGRAMSEAFELRQRGDDRERLRDPSHLPRRSSVRQPSSSAWSASTWRHPADCDFPADEPSVLSRGGAPSRTSGVPRRPAGKSRTGQAPEPESVRLRVRTVFSWEAACRKYGGLPGGRGARVNAHRHGRKREVFFPTP